MRLLCLSLLAALICVPSIAHAATLPQAEIGSEQPGFVAGEPSGVVDAEAPPAAEATPYLVIHSKGYSRFEIGDEGHIVVVYSGGVDFNYLGYAFVANELHFDQAARTANLKGDVHFDSEKFSLSTQEISINGATGHAEVSGRIVGSMIESGLRFEANRAQFTFPPESNELHPEQIQFVLSGDVAFYSRDGAELRTDQIAFDGATGRFASAPFTLRIPLPGKEGQPSQSVQVTGTAFGGSLSEKGEVAQVDVLGLLAVSRVGRISAAQAVARPDAASGTWQVQVSGSPVRLEYSGPLEFALSKKQPPANVGPVLIESSSASLQIDSAGLKSAAMKGGVTIFAAGLPIGNMLTLGSVSVDRREAGMAISAGNLSLGLDLSRLLGIEPVDLSDLIK